MASPSPAPAPAVPHSEEEPAPPAAAAASAEETVIGEEEEEEEGECGFCLYMKGGGCRDAFVAWEECVEAAGKEEGADMVERCFEVTANLKKCMDAHADYYAPVLRAEEAVSDHADAAIAAAADQSKESGEAPAPSPSTDESKVVDEKKEEVDDKSSSSVGAIDERKEEEVVTEKADS
uniref:GCK domain-containing protein n=1 Tax=Leersia perrieri TaxID=77586 RepID=A0A0D9WVM6_9ORYZ